MATIAETYADMKVRRVLNAMLPAISEIDFGCYECVSKFCEMASMALRPLGWQILFDVDAYLEQSELDIPDFLQVLPVKDNEKV